MHTYKLILAICFTAFAVSSCKKNKNEDPAPAPVIPGVNLKVKIMDYMEHPNAGYHFRYVYNSQNNVDSIIVTGVGSYSTYPTTIQKYTYENSSYKITVLYADSAVAGTDYYITYNSDGLVTKRVDPGDTTFYTYNGKELAAERRSFGKPEFFKFTWANGDIQQRLFTDTTVEHAYSYDTSIYYQPLPDDLLEFSQLGHYPKHLLTGINLGGRQVSYYYNFDVTGRPIKKTTVWNVSDTGLVNTYTY